MMFAVPLALQRHSLKSKPTKMASGEKNRQQNNANLR